jgi:hypothetical protein
LSYFQPQQKLKIKIMGLACLPALSSHPPAVTALFVSSPHSATLHCGLSTSIASPAYASLPTSQAYITVYRLSLHFFAHTVLTLHHHISSIWGYLILTLFLFMGNSCKSSKESAASKPFKFSSTTDYYDAERFEAVKKKRTRILYTHNTKKVLLGNYCVTEFTQSLGFEYQPAFVNATEPRNELAIYAHNFITNIALTFRNGPFWKRKVKKRIKFCRTTTGDFIG